MPKKTPPLLLTKEEPQESNADELDYADVRQEHLPKIGSLSRECTKLKEKYDTCFMEWYIEDFLQGKSKVDMIPCEELFKDYQKCVKRTLKRLEIPTEPIASCSL